MTALTSPVLRASRLFGEDEPVVQSTPLLPGAVVPTFGVTDAWRLHGVIRTPVNQYATQARPLFTGMNATWNLRAREMAMIWLNPQHPAVIERGLHLGQAPRKPNTVRMRVGLLRQLATWAAQTGMPERLSAWTAEELIGYVRGLAQLLKPGSLNEHIVVIKSLHEFASALTGGGLAADPWPGVSARRALNGTVDETLKTEAVSPAVWFALVKAAWTYIDVFGPDILRALDRWRAIKAAARAMPLAEARTLCYAWLNNPANSVPLHVTRPSRSDSDVNFSLLAYMIGINVRQAANPFAADVTGSRPLRELAEAVARTRSQYGVIADMVEVERPDGTRGPWHTGLHPRALWLEAVALRNACYCLCLALSMMRDGEIREITKGSVVQHYGSPAVKATKTKRDDALPTKHWWIIEPVARAIEIAEQLSLDDELAFAAVRPGSTGPVFPSKWAIISFIKRVNANRHVTGLPHIAEEDLAPHMFRVTMAMLTRDQPGSEIAIGMQLKHVATRALANKLSMSYAAPSKKWLGLLDDAVAQARFRRLRDLFDAHHRGEPIGYGPGADRIRETFDAIRAEAVRLRDTGQARHGDRRVEHDILRRTRLTIRFGTLNHCTMDAANPAGAKCLEDTVVPAGHSGPLQDRCQPSRCANSVLAPEHVPIWTVERGSLLRLIASPGLPACRKAALNGQLAEVELMLRRIPA